MSTRKEEDLLGTLEIDNTKYYGVQTQRALNNFKISHTSISQYPQLTEGMIYVKKAAALANCEIGLLAKDKADAIVKACDEMLRTKKCYDQFQSDIFQGGAGTSVNMNANEVIANVALELLGKEKGDYSVINPCDDVNMGQSTNDAYSTGMKIAAYSSLDPVIAELKLLIQSIEKKAKEFAKHIKMGRTQLQDAVPMSIGQEFQSFADSLSQDIANLEYAQKLFLAINLGGTAIGTGVNAGKGYKEAVVKHLSDITKRPYVTAKNLITATWDCGDYVTLSSTLKVLAVRLSKICNDLRLLSAGPRANIKEINLPEMQPGSSIMPAKVNPVIPEVVNQVCFTVIGNDIAVTMSAEAGQLELNVMEPAIAKAIFESSEILTNAMRTLRELCIDGITINAERCKEQVLSNIGIVTYFNPYIGHHEGDLRGKECAKTGKNVREVILEKGLLTEKEIDEILSIENLMNPTIIEHIKKK